MDQNAFKALFKTPNEAARRLSDIGPKPAKRQRPSPFKQPQKHAMNSGSRFTECPVCGKSIHTLLINGHVERCLSAAHDDDGSTKAIPAVDDTSEQFPLQESYQQGSTLSCTPCDDGYTDIDADPGAGADAVGASAEVKGDVVISTTASPLSAPQSASALASASPSPICTEGQPSTGEVGPRGPVDQSASAGESHPFSPTSKATDLVVLEMGKSGGDRWTSNCSPSDRKGQPLDASVCAEGQNRAADTGVSEYRADKTDNNNVFARLMEASALSDFREEMYLWRHEDGTFSWGWGVAGRACPAPPSAVTNESRWVCRVPTKGPDGRKAGTCELWTNVPPLSTVPGGGGAYTGTMKRMGDRTGAVSRGAAASDNSGIRAVLPSASLSRLSVPVLKSVLQKSIRRRRAEAAVRCALELALKSWNDAIRRILVIVAEDSFLHPAAPLLAWLMVATSKGYRPPPCFVDAFLCTVYEIAKCPVRDSTGSCRTTKPTDGEAENCMDDHFAPPHPRDMVAPISTAWTATVPTTHRAPTGETKRHASTAAEPEASAGGDACRGVVATSKDQHDTHFADEAGGKLTTAVAAGFQIACCRRALLMRMSYGGMAFDQTLLKGSVLSWGERCGHVTQTPRDASTATKSCSGSLSGGRTTGSTPPSPPKLPPSLHDHASGNGVTEPFGYMHHSVKAAHTGHAWATFLLASYIGCGMPEPLRSKLIAHVEGGDISGISSGAIHPTGRSNLPDLGSCHKIHGSVPPKAGETCGEGTSSPTAKSYKSPHVAAGSTDGEGTAVGLGRDVRGSPASRRPALGPIIREADAVLTGVDYHCSNVLEEVLRSSIVRERVERALQGTGRVVGGGLHEGLDDGPTSYGGRVPGKRIEQAAKRAMWECSSGLNARKLQLAFVWDTRRSNGSLNQAQAVLHEVQGDAGPSSCVDARVWAALSDDVVLWTRRFVHAKLAPGAVGRSPHPLPQTRPNASMV